MVLNKAHVEPEAKPNQRKPAPGAHAVSHDVNLYVTVYGDSLVHQDFHH